MMMLVFRVLKVLTILIAYLQQLYAINTPVMFSGEGTYVSLGQWELYRNMYKSQDL